ncbi:glycosyl transferase [Burkholderia ubonensis]|uniref:glycosyl transferase n=1 Tax=Burkholderia ubonensis TaxID=101571 RepID=UPI00075F4C13|nr:glycosyl transferase [Burkholderia ubonensis]KVD75071.1 glycosyl transferase [Burkholderia ubonensis]
MKKKILLACSHGGHYVQLSLLVSAFADLEVVWAVSGNKTLQAGNDGYRLIDANKQTPVKLAALACQVMKIVARERPDIVVSTGAAPGLFAVMFGRMLGAKTVWIDSIANSARLSLSGRIARHFASETLTQWQHLETTHVRFWGCVL